MTNPHLRIGLVGFGQRAQLAKELGRPGIDAPVVGIVDSSDRGRAAAAVAHPGALVAAERVQRKVDA